MLQTARVHWRAVSAPAYDHVRPRTTNDATAALRRPRVPVSCDATLGSRRAAARPRTGVSPPLSVVDADEGAREVQDAARHGDEARAYAHRRGWSAAGRARATPSFAPRPRDAGRVGPCARCACGALAGDPVLHAPGGALVPAPPVVSARVRVPRLGPAPRAAAPARTHGRHRVEPGRPHAAACGGRARSPRLPRPRAGRRSGP